MLALPIKGATYRGKGLGERENLGGHEQIRVHTPDGMPINAFGGDRNLRYQICACEGNTFLCRAPQCDSTDDAIFFRDFLRIEKATEIPCLFVT